MHGADEFVGAFQVSKRVGNADQVPITVCPNGSNEVRSANNRWTASRVYGSYRERAFHVPGEAEHRAGGYLRAGGEAKAHQRATNQHHQRFAIFHNEFLSCFLTETLSRFPLPTGEGR